MYGSENMIFRKMFLEKTHETSSKFDGSGCVFERKVVKWGIVEL